MCELAGITASVTYTTATEYTSTRAWAKFPNPGIASGSITAAKLRLYATSVSGSPAFQVRKSNTNFPISVSSYANESGQVVASVSAVTANQWLEINIPPDKVSLNQENAFCLDPNLSNPPAQSFSAEFKSADAAADKPQLVIEWQQVTPQIEATAQDAASIAQYGLRRMMIFDPRLTQAECETMAAKEVALRAWPQQSIRLSTLAGAGISPGQLVSVLFDEVGLAGSYVAQAVSATYAAAGIVQYEMTLDRFRPDLIRYLSE
jgi:hypothetical protein